MDGSIHLFDRLPQVDAVPPAENDIAISSVRTRPLVGLIRNGRSHRNEGHGNGRSEGRGSGLTRQAPQRLSLCALTGVGRYIGPITGHHPRQQKPGQKQQRATIDHALGRDLGKDQKTQCTRDDR